MICFANFLFPPHSFLPHVSPPFLVFFFVLQNSFSSFILLSFSIFCFFFPHRFLPLFNCWLYLVLTRSFPTFLPSLPFYFCISFQFSYDASLLSLSPYLSLPHFALIPSLSLTFSSYIRLSSLFLLSLFLSPYRSRCLSLLFILSLFPLIYHSCFLLILFIIPLLHLLLSFVFHLSPNPSSFPYILYFSSLSLHPSFLPLSLSASLSLSLYSSFINPFLFLSSLSIYASFLSSHFFLS